MLLLGLDPVDGNGNQSHVSFEEPSGIPWSGWCSTSPWFSTYFRGFMCVCPQVGLQGSSGPSDHPAKIPGSRVKANQREIFFSCRV